MGFLLEKQVDFFERTEQPKLNEGILARKE